MKNIFKSIIVSILTFEAKMLLRRAKPKIVAVTGNVGKTATKDAIYDVLKEQYSVRKSEKSYNSEIGVPLSVLGLPNAWSNPFLWIKNIIDGLLHALFPSDYPEVIVLEMGVDRPGDMANLTEWIQPDVVVLTRLPDVPVHVEYFDSPESVIEEKMTLVEALKSDGVFVYNHDDEKVRMAAGSIRQQALGYSRYSPSHFSVTADTIQYKKGKPVGLDFTLAHLTEEVHMKAVGSIGVQHAYNYAAACAVGFVFEVPLTKCAEALSTHLSPPGRMRIIDGIKDTLIIDDTYNSSPVASERALSSLNELKGFKRKIAVLGDMLELGHFSVREHERVGEQVAEVADVLITVGVRAQKIASVALAHGMSEKNILQYDESIRTGRELQNFIKKGDVLLIKGSQSIRCERIVEDIMAQPERVSELLVRQSAAWKKID